ncbi:PREDICTED: uncharacterized protein LOC107072304 [Polistes dominula]|uniref:Uncharacterized protein LOC107072304 n=1 Tax=Polistes dominula TaxID=743375 RepID=A0ABM1J565_POLDO|nr:PREDICTED: uncharacterized protein LOC107072304 [Polistes dominula]
MAPSNKVQINSDPVQFESITKLSNLPIVESGIHIAGHVYKRIKSANVLMNWSLDAAETSLALAAASAKPAICTFNGPITTIDQLLCKGIDIVEQRVPAVHIPPQHMYWYTRDYVSNKILRPVLLRAGTVKQIGSHAASIAVDTLDSALTMADQYVDHYLPDDTADKTVDEVDSKKAVSKTTRTIQHGARFSRKLQRRLTRRTLAEARALKEQGTECIHVFLYVIELIAKDPKLALQKAKELWASLSLPEPENQARPTNLEQFFVLLTRESARRIVHLVNGAASLAARTPRRIGKLLIRISRRLLTLTDATLKAASIIGTEETTQTQQMSMILRSVVRKLGTNTNRLLVRTASRTTCISSEHEGCNDCNNDGVKKNDGNRNKDRNRKSNNIHRNDNDEYIVKVESSTRSSTEPQQPHVDDFRCTGKRHRVTKQNPETVSSGFLPPSGNEKLLDYHPRSTAHRNIISTTTSSTPSSSSSSSSSLSCSSTSSRKRVTNKQTYSKLKDSHWLVHWALTTAENSFESATRQAVPIAAPLAKKFEIPIHFVDHTLCFGLDKIEERVPLVKEKPEQILANAYDLAVKKVQPAVSTIYYVNDALLEQATNLRDISWNKANQLLDTHYGIEAVKRLDSTAVIVDKLIDIYFPAIGNEDETKEKKSKMAETKQENSSGPQLEVLNRMKKIPMVHSAIEKTESTYSYLKDSNQFVNWAMKYVEAGFNYATATAVPIAAPLAKKFEGQINAVDQKLCEGLDIVEKKVPMVKQPPQEIYDAAKAVMSSPIQPTIEKLHSLKTSATVHASALKEISITKTNELLNTQFGTMAVQGVDNTSVLIDRLLDHYFPAVGGEESTPNPVSAEENKILHIVQKVGHLSTKTANRVYHSVVAQLKTITEEDVKNYTSSVLSILHLTQFLSSAQEQTEEKTSSTPTQEKK